MKLYEKAGYLVTTFDLFQRGNIIFAFLFDLWTARVKCAA